MSGRITKNSKKDSLKGYPSTPKSYDFRRRGHQKRTSAYLQNCSPNVPQKLRFGCPFWHHLPLSRPSRTIPKSAAKNMPYLSKNDPKWVPKLVPEMLQIHPWGTSGRQYLTPGRLQLQFRPKLDPKSKKNTQEIAINRSSEPKQLRL